MTSKAVPELNTTASIVLKNLLKDDNDAFQPFFMPRVAATPQEPRLAMVLDPATLPKRPPSNLPAPGDVELELEIGELLGNGRSSTVYAVSIVNKNGYMPSLADIEFPSLAVKISRGSAASSLDREAWHYDEMEILQGSVIPRNFGLFTARPPHLRSIASVDCDEARWEPFGGTISVLLLERTGGAVPFKEEFEDGGDDIYELYHDLSVLGIYHNDLRTENILRVPVDYPSAPCPFHNHTHRHRLIDFESSYKTNFPADKLYEGHISWAEDIVKGLKAGWYFESEEQ